MPWIELHCSCQKKKHSSISGRSPIKGIKKIILFCSQKKRKHHFLEWPFTNYFDLSLIFFVFYIRNSLVESSRQAHCTENSEVLLNCLRRQSQISSFRVTRPTLKFRVDSSRRLGNFVGIFWCDVDFYTSAKVFFRRAFCCLFTF